MRERQSEHERCKNGRCARAVRNAARGRPNATLADATSESEHAEVEHDARTKAGSEKSKEVRKRMMPYERNAAREEGGGVGGVRGGEDHSKR